MGDEPMFTVGFRGQTPTGTTPFLVDASRVLSHLERPDAPLKRRAGTCHQHQKAVPMTDSSHSMNLRGARPGVSVTQLRRRANVYDFTP